MSELVKAAKRLVNRNPAWQSPEVHLKSVAQLISSVSQDETMIAAAWLHDIVEDTPVTLGDIELQFGAAVAKIVGELNICHSLLMPLFRFPSPGTRRLPESSGR